MQMFFSKDTKKPLYFNSQLNTSSPHTPVKDYIKQQETHIIFTSSIKYDMLNRLMNTIPCDSCKK